MGLEMYLSNNFSGNLDDAGSGPYREPLLCIDLEEGFVLKIVFLGEKT